jgi:hypothetical protein
MSELFEFALALENCSSVEDTCNIRPARNIQEKRLVLIRLKELVGEKLGTVITV